MFITLRSVPQMQIELAARLRAERLSQGLTQATLGEKAGVPVPTIRRFERTGEAPLATFLKIVFALGRADEVEALFASTRAVNASGNLDEMLRRAESPRKRGRRSDAKTQ